MRKVAGADQYPRSILASFQACGASQGSAAELLGELVGDAIELLVTSAVRLVEQMPLGCRWRFQIRNTEPQ